MGKNNVKISISADTAAAKAKLNSFSKEINNSKRAVRDLTGAYEQLDDATKQSSIGKQMQKDLQSAIARYKELEKIQNQINRNLGKVPTNNLSGLSSSMNALTETADAFGSKFGLSTAALAKMASPAGLAVAAVGAVGSAMYTGEKHAIEFEDALSNLSAITGASGRDLDALKDRIIETGKETHTSFKTIADAYTVIGSKMPDLLQNQEGLDAVTRSVITLKKASRMSLEDATNSLTGIMNQMGASFFEADTYINVLAAGSKAGAGDIQYLATAFDQCGTAVNTAGLSIQQGTALIETLAKKQPSASTAGVQLRNVLIKLTTASDEYNPKVVGLTTALENLSKKTGDTSFMVKMFGAENMSAAIQLANNANTVDNLTKAVTDTEEAHKQAAIQTDNVASAARGLKQDWDNFATAIMTSSGPIQTAIRGVIGGLGEILTLMNYLAGGKTEKEIGFDVNTDKIKNRARVATEKSGKAGETSAQKQLRYARELTKEIIKQKKFRDAAIKNGESKENIRLRNQQINKLGYERQQAKEGKLNIFNTSENSSPVVNTPPHYTPHYTPHTTRRPHTPTTNTEVFNPGSIAALNQEVRKLQKERDNLADPTKIAEVDAKIKSIKDNISALNYSAQMIDFDKVFGDTSSLSNQLSKSGLDLTKSILGDQKINFDVNSADLKNVGDAISDWIEKMKEADPQFQSMKEEIESIGQAGKDAFSNFGGDMASYTDMFTNLGKVFVSDADAATKAGAGLSVVGQMMSQVAGNGDAAKVGAILAAVGQITLGFANASVQAAALGPFGWIAWLGAGLAAVATTISTIKGFNDGGIVNGSTTTGDNTLVRVNRGEMILNNRQQAHLFKMLDGGLALNTQSSGGSVNFKISGSNLYGTLKNYSNMQSKVGRNTGIR